MIKEDGNTHERERRRTEKDRDLERERKKYARPSGKASRKVTKTKRKTAEKRKKAAERRRKAARKNRKKSRRSRLKINVRDLILAGGILLLAGIAYLASTIFLPHGTSYIRITVNGETYGVYSLNEDQDIAIGNSNVCRIRDGAAKMVEANCPDQLCIHQSAIDGHGGTIVCLPNRVVVQAASENAGESSEEEDGLSVDAVT